MSRIESRWSAPNLAIAGAVVIEITSPDDPERDTVAKRANYEEARISEYSIVNPEDEIIIVPRLDSYR